MCLASSVAAGSVATSALAESQFHVGARALKVSVGRSGTTHHTVNRAGYMASDSAQYGSGSATWTEPSIDYGSVAFEYVGGPVFPGTRCRRWSGTWGTPYFKRSSMTIPRIGAIFVTGHGIQPAASTVETIGEHPCNDFACSTQPALANFGNIVYSSVQVNNASIGGFDPKTN